MDDFKVVTLFLVLGITINTFVPVTSNYGLFQPQYFQVPALQHPYTPYAYYDILKINPDGRTVPSAVYPNGLPPNLQPQMPRVYTYFETPIYDFRYPVVPFYPGERPVFSPPLPPPGTQDPSSIDEPKKDDDDDDDDGIEKLDKDNIKQEDKTTKKIEESEGTPEPIENVTEPSEDSLTEEALE